MSTGNRIDYCFMSKAMQEFDGLNWPRKGELLPDDVATERFVRDAHNIAEARRHQADVDLRKWFGGPRKIEILEEIQGLGAYGKTLTVITSEIFADDDADDDESIEEHWTPRFHRR
jgi:hypothetical protein